MLAPVVDCTGRSRMCRRMRQRAAATFPRPPGKRCCTRKSPHRLYIWQHRWTLDACKSTYRYLLWEIDINFRDNSQIQELDFTVLALAASELLRALAQVGSEALSTVLTFRIANRCKSLYYWKMCGKCAQNTNNLLNIFFSVSTILYLKIKQKVKLVVLWFNIKEFLLY